VTHLFVFLAAGVSDALWVLWFHHSGRDQAWHAGAVSGLLGLVWLAGVSPAIKDWHFAPAYLAGLCVGSYTAVRWKAWRKWNT